MSLGFHRARHEEARSFLNFDFRLFRHRGAFLARNRLHPSVAPASGGDLRLGGVLVLVVVNHERYVDSHSARRCIDRAARRKRNPRYALRWGSASLLRLESRREGVLDGGRPHAAYVSCSGPPGAVGRPSMRVRVPIQPSSVKTLALWRRNLTCGERVFGYLGTRGL